MAKTLFGRFKHACDMQKCCLCKIWDTGSAWLTAASALIHYNTQLNRIFTHSLGSRLLFVHS